MPVAVLREMSRSACPTCGCGTSTARPRSRRWPPCSSPKTSCASPAHAGRPALNVETRVVDDTMQRHHCRRSRRDRAPLAATDAARATTTIPSARRRRSRAAGSTAGDLATIDAEGYITVVDRKKDMIKTWRRKRRQPRSRGSHLRLPQVSEVAVIGLPHPRWIEAVTAVVVVKAGHTLDASARCSRTPAAAGWRASRCPKGGGVRRRAAQEPERQAAQARAAQAVRGAFLRLTPAHSAARSAQRLRGNPMCPRRGGKGPWARRSAQPALACGPAVQRRTGSFAAPALWASLRNRPTRRCKCSPGGHPGCALRLDWACFGGLRGRMGWPLNLSVGILLRHEPAGDLGGNRHVIRPLAQRIDPRPEPGATGEAALVLGSPLPPDRP